MADIRIKVAKDKAKLVKALRAGGGFDRVISDLRGYNGIYRLF